MIGHNIEGGKGSSETVSDKLNREEEDNISDWEYCDILEK